MVTLVQNVNVALHQAVCICQHFVHHQLDLSAWAMGQSDAIESLDIFWWGLRDVMEACWHSASKAEEAREVGEEPIRFMALNLSPLYGCTLEHCHDQTTMSANRILELAE